VRIDSRTESPVGCCQTVVSSGGEDNVLWHILRHQAAFSQQRNKLAYTRRLHKLRRLTSVPRIAWTVVVDQADCTRNRVVLAAVAEAVITLSRIVDAAAIASALRAEQMRP